jgi:hypothetical protein
VEQCLDDPALLRHTTTRVRWEAMHALALVAALAADRMLALLPMLGELLRRDASTIVRDYAVDALGGIAQAGEAAAAQVYPLLQEALTAAGGKHAGRALAALAHVARSAPALAPEIAQHARDYADHAKPVVRKAAKALLRAVQL